MIDRQRLFEYQEHTGRFLFESYKHLTTLSFSAIIGIVALLQLISGTPKWEPLVYVSLICLVASVVGSVLAMFSTIWNRISIKGGATPENGTTAGNWLFLVFLIVSAGGFLAGIVSFGIFAIVNAPV